VNEQPSVPNLPRILSSGVPPQALAFYGRWWQLETWLREMVYVELRSRYGLRWTDYLQGRVPKRAASDEDNAYMASADAGELITYADVFRPVRLDRSPVGFVQTAIATPTALARHSGRVARAA
jgi:hypothetical protein